MTDNLIFLIKICHEIKQMEKFCNRLLHVVLKSLSNETIKIFCCHFPLKLKPCSLFISGCSLFITGLENLYNYYPRKSSKV